MQEEIYTVKQVQDILKVSERTVFRLIKSKQLKGFKIGREWRFTQGDINNFIQRQRQQADENVA